MNPNKVGILKDIAKGLLVSSGGSGLEAVTPDLPTFSQIAGLFSRKKDYDDYEDKDEDDSYEEVYEYDTKNLENLAEEILKTLLDINLFRENNYEYKKSLEDYHSIILARRHKETLKVFEDVIGGKFKAIAANPLKLPSKEKSKLPLLLGGLAIGGMALLLPTLSYGKKLEEEFGFNELKKEVDDFETEVTAAETEVLSLDKELDALSEESLDTELNEIEKSLKSEETEIQKILSDVDSETKKLEDESNKVKLEPQEQKVPEVTQSTEQLQQVETQVQQLQQQIDKQEVAPVEEERLAPVVEIPRLPEIAPEVPTLPIAQRASQERLVLPTPTPAPVAPTVTPRPVTAPAPAPAALPAPPVAQVPPFRPGVAGPTVRPSVPATVRAPTAAPVRRTEPSATIASATITSVEDVKALIGRAEGGNLTYNAINVPVIQKPSSYSKEVRGKIYTQLFKEAEIVKGNVDVTTGKSFDKNLNEMSIEEVIELGKRRIQHYNNFVFDGKKVELAVSSAAGKFGFTVAAIADNASKLFGVNWKKEIFDTKTQEEMQSFLLTRNIIKLENEKTPVSTALLYMKHFFGPNSPKPLQILNAKDDEKMENIMSETQKNSNPVQASMTVKQYKEHLAQKGFSFDVIDTKKLISEEVRKKNDVVKVTPEVNRDMGKKVSDASTVNKTERMTSTAAAAQTQVLVVNNNNTVINQRSVGYTAPRQVNNNPGLA